jgi:hypothetical protein
MSLWAARPCRFDDGVMARGILCAARQTRGRVGCERQRVLCVFYYDSVCCRVGGAVCVRACVYVRVAVAVTRVGPLLCITRTGGWSVIRNLIFVD